MASRDAATGTRSMTRATEARADTYAGSAATLAMVIDKSTSSNCVYGSLDGGRRGGSSVATPKSNVPRRSSVTRRAGTL